MANSYYEDYLAKTNGGLRESTLLKQEEKAPSSKKSIILIVLFLVLVAEGFYLWQKNQETQSKVDNPTEALLAMTKPENDIKEILEEREKNTTLPKSITTTESKKSKKVTKAIIKPKELNNTKVLIEKIEKKIIENNTTKSKKIEIAIIVPSKTKEKNTSIKAKPIQKVIIKNPLETKLLSASEKSKIHQQTRDNKKIDTFNKVILDRSVTEPSPMVKALSRIIDDFELRQLEKKSIPVLETNTTVKKVKKKTENKALKKEAKVRKEEMRYVKVKSGDSLYKIAKRMYGDASKFELIFKANSDILKKKTDLKIGQKLRVPKLKKAQ